jgi:hypothetical protein
MQTVNFQCGHCGKLMAVTANLLGRQVRCPHCQQVVVAPPPAPAPDPAPPPAPIFQPPPPPEHESIFSPPEDHDEDLFGRSRLPQPELPPEPPIDLELSAPLPPPPPEETLAYRPPEEEPPPLPLFQEQPASIEPGAAMPDPTLTWAPPPGPPDVQPADEQSLPVEDFPRPTPRAPKASRGPLTTLLVITLVSYSVIVTGLLGYALWALAAERANRGWLLPDEGFNSPATKANRQGLRLSPAGDLKLDDKQMALLDLPPRQRTTMNKPLTLMDLEVTPLRAELRKATIHVPGYKPDPGKYESLVLYLQLKNVSEDVEFCPLDPYFDRQYAEAATRGGLPYTYLTVGPNKFFGGTAKYNEKKDGETLSIQGLDDSLRELVGGENLPQDAGRLLKPGESMVSFVCTNSADDRVAEAVKSPGGKMLYRVRLRNGMNVWRGKEVPTSVVAGIEISPEEIHKR